MKIVQGIPMHLACLLLANLIARRELKEPLIVGGGSCESLSINKSVLSKLKERKKDSLTCAICGESEGHLDHCKPCHRTPTCSKIFHPICAYLVSPI